MSDDVWRPLGFEGENAEMYDALQEGVPEWMAESFWLWMKVSMTIRRTVSPYGDTYEIFAGNLASAMARVCRLPLNYYEDSVSQGLAVLRKVGTTLGAELRMADYLVSTSNANARALDAILAESGSTWTVGVRAGKPGLIRRVPEGAQRNAEAVMASSGQAGTDLRQAWEAIYGLTPNASEAYRLAVRAVEHAAIPVVCPQQAGATLGHVIGQLRTDGDWGLPLTREDATAPTSETVLRLCQALWKGHHDRHGGVVGAPQTVAQEEAETAVTIAVALVQWFVSGMLARR